jgi:hypothetical protein
VAYLPGNALGSSYTVSGIEIQKNSGGLGMANISLNFIEIPICDPSTDVLVIT